MGVIFFRIHDPSLLLGFSESEKAGGARRPRLPVLDARANFASQGAKAAAGPERLPRLPRRFTRVRRIDAPLHAKA